MISKMSLHKLVKMIHWKLKNEVIYYRYEFFKQRQITVRINPKNLYNNKKLYIKFKTNVLLDVVNLRLT